MAENNTNNGANTPEEEGSKQKKGFKETAKGVWNFITTNPVTKTAGKILLGVGLIGAGAFLGGVGVGIKEEHARSKSERADEGETVILSDPEPEYEAPAEEVVETSFEEAPVEEQAE